MLKADEATKTSRHPAEGAAEFWTKEARRTSDALDATRNEMADLERHYRLALAEIKALQAQVRALTIEDEKAHAEENRQLRLALSAIALEASRCRGEQSYRNTISFVGKQARAALGKRGIERSVEICRG